jgi:hypothetical protein
MLCAYFNCLWFDRTENRTHDLSHINLYTTDAVKSTYDMLDVMVLTAAFNNISVISWRSDLLVEETEYSEKTTDLPIQYVIKRTASISYIANYPCIPKTTYRSSKERLGLWLWCWTTLATLFQLYRCGQFYWWRKNTNMCD